MIDTFIFCLPLVIVGLCVVSGLTIHIKCRQKLKERDGYLAHLGLNVATCVMGILVIILNSRSIDEAGFVAPIIMGLILMGFFWFMTLLPIISLSKDKGHSEL